MIPDLENTSSEERRFSIMGRARQARDMPPCSDMPHLNNQFGTSQPQKPHVLMEWKNIRTLLRHQQRISKWIVNDVQGRWKTSFKCQSVSDSHVSLEICQGKIALSFTRISPIILLSSSPPTSPPLNTSIAHHPHF